MASKKKNPTTTTTLDPAPELVPVAPDPGQDPSTYTPENILFLEQEKSQLISTLGIDPKSLQTPPPVKSKKVVKVVVPDVPVAEIPPTSIPKPEPHEVTVPGMPSSLVLAQAQVDAEAELKKTQLAKDHQAKVLKLKKSHVDYNKSQSLDTDAISALAAVVADKIHAATIVPKQEARQAELDAVLKPLSQSRRIAQALLNELAAIDLSPYAAVLGWDVPTFERQKIITGEQARRLRAALDTIRELGNVRRQLTEVVQDIDAFQSTPLRGHTLRQEARQLAQVVVWSTSWPYNLLRSITDLRHILTEMAKTQLKSDPSTIILEPSHAALSQLLGPKVTVKDHASTDFNPVGA